MCPVFCVVHATWYQKGEDRYALQDHPVGPLWRADIQRLWAGSFALWLRHHEVVTARVVAPQFAGLSLIEQHRLVYAAVERDLGSGAIHALSIKTSVKES